MTKHLRKGGAATHWVLSIRYSVIGLVSNALGIVRMAMIVGVVLLSTSMIQAQDAAIPTPSPTPSITPSPTPLPKDDVQTEPSVEVQTAPQDGMQAPPRFATSFRVTLLSDYVARGITSTQGRPAIQAYGEIRHRNGLYFGVLGSSVSRPESLGLTGPSAEINFTAGRRHMLWRKLMLDFGMYYSWYVDEKPELTDTDSWGAFASGRFIVTPELSLTGGVFWTPDRGGMGVKGDYFTGGASYNLPFSFDKTKGGSFVSAEVGRQLVGSFQEFDFPNHTTWKAGLGYRHKNMTYELTYSDSDLTKAECLPAAGNPSWCGKRVFLSAAFDFNFNLK